MAWADAATNGVTSAYATDLATYSYSLDPKPRTLNPEADWPASGWTGLALSLEPERRSLTVNYCRNPDAAKIGTT